MNYDELLLRSEAQRRANVGVVLIHAVAVSELRRGMRRRAIGRLRVLARPVRLARRAPGRAEAGAIPIHA